METTTAPVSLWDALTQHLSPDAAWVPVGGALLAALVGLLFLVKGARLAPILAALVFAALGALGGTVLAYVLSLPFWPAVIVATTIGLVLGVVLFRLWFALLVAGCMIAGGLSVYSGNVLQPALREYQVRGLQPGAPDGAVTLPQAPTTSPATAAWHTELGNLWSYLDGRVPAFRTNLYTIVIVTGLAGLAFGLLLPRAARAFWAATTGTLLFVPAVLAVAHTSSPDVAAWLVLRAQLCAAVLWSMSFIYNLADVLDWRPKKTAPARSGGSPI